MVKFSAAITVFIIIRLGKARRSGDFRKKYVVTALRPEFNEVILGEESDLYQKKIFLKELHFIDGSLYSGEIQFKICRWGYLYPGRLHLSGDRRGYLECEKAVRAPMPGQSAVFYDGDRLFRRRNHRV